MLQPQRAKPAHSSRIRRLWSEFELWNGWQLHVSKNVSVIRLLNFSAFVFLPGNVTLSPPNPVQFPMLVFMRCNYTFVGIYVVLLLTESDSRMSTFRRDKTMSLLPPLLPQWPTQLASFVHCHGMIGLRVQAPRSRPISPSMESSTKWSSRT
jgi:hypothetical protein